MRKLKSKLLARTEELLKNKNAREYKHPSLNSPGPAFPLIIASAFCYYFWEY